MTTSRIACLAADACCVRITVKDSEYLRIFEGGEMRSFSTQISSDIDETSTVRKTGILPMTTWKSKWLLLVMPNGRASLFEYLRNRLTLHSTFDCPLNTSAVLMVDDEFEDCALAIFGTDEGARASCVHIARIMFSSESLSVKLLKSWRCAGGVSSLAQLNQRLVLVGYSSCGGVGMFDPSYFEDPESPALGGRQRPTAAKSPLSPERYDPDKEDFIKSRILGEVPVWVSVKGQNVLTLTQCGTFCFYSDSNLEHPERTMFLGFDCLGLRTIPTDDGIVVCGWRGEVAVVDLETGQIARFLRTRETARVDDLAISVSSDSRLLLLQADADQGGALKVFDFGRAALLGSSKPPDDRIQLEGDIDDDLVFVGTDDGSEIPEDSTQAALMLKEAWDLLVLEDE